MLPPIIKTIEVPCSQEKAFTVFLNEMDSWWPLGKFSVSAMGGAPAKAIRVEAKPGGKIVEIGPNGTEYFVGHDQIIRSPRLRQHGLSLRPTR
jgi:hypothetical protein